MCIRATGPGRLAGIVLVLAWTGLPVYGQFGVNFTFSGATSSQETIFEQAAALWEEVILGYEAGINQSSIAIAAAVSDLGGVGGTLGSAGITRTVRRGGFTLATHGVITIDSDDIGGLESNGRLLSVLAHEIGHILGIGSLWVANNAYVSGTGRYTGEFAVAAYREEFDARARFVPVELDGGPGTANAHWDETSSVRNAEGEPLGSELMTGFLSGSAFLSNTTIQSLRDLGFVVVAPNVAIGVTLGDADGNGVLDAFDVGGFELALADRQGYAALFPEIDPDVVGDFNADGVFDAFDVAGFQAALAIGGSPVPEPAVVVWFLGAALARGGRPRSRPPGVNHCAAMR